MAEHTPMPEQIADAIEIISMCEPIEEVQGDMWFGRNNNFADATFVDYGACRAFAVAARALPILVKRETALVKALQQIANGEFDYLKDAMNAAGNALSSIKDRT